MVYTVSFKKEKDEEIVKKFKAYTRHLGIKQSQLLSEFMNEINEHIEWIYDMSIETGIPMKVEQNKISVMTELDYNKLSGLEKLSELYQLKKENEKNKEK